MDFEKDTYDDSVEFLFRNKYLGNAKFSSGWQMAFATRYTSVCTEITKIKRKSKEDLIRILDLGCSNKTFWRFWCSNFESAARPRVKYTGLEYRKEVVDIANLDVPSKPSFNSSYVYRADLNNQHLDEFCKGKYDVVLMMEIVEHLYEDSFFNRLMEAREFLSNRGFLVISSPNPKKEEGQEFVWPENHIKEYTLFEMIGHLKDAGFNVYKANGWLGKANYLKKHLDERGLGIYNSIRTISAGFATSVLAYMYPNFAECYTIFCKRGKLIWT